MTDPADKQESSKEKADAAEDDFGDFGDFDDQAKDDNGANTETKQEDDWTGFGDEKASKPETEASLEPKSSDFAENYKD